MEKNGSAYCFVFSIVFFICLLLLVFVLLAYDGTLGIDSPGELVLKLWP